MTSAVLGRDLTPDEGSAASRVLMAHQKMIDTANLELRLREMEARMDARQRLLTDKAAK